MVQAALTAQVAAVLRALADAQEQIASERHHREQLALDFERLRAIQVEQNAILLELVGPRSALGGARVLGGQDSQASRTERLLGSGNMRAKQDYRAGSAPGSARLDESEPIQGGCRTSPRRAGSTPNSSRVTAERSQEGANTNSSQVATIADNLLSGCDNVRECTNKDESAAVMREQADPTFQCSNHWVEVGRRGARASPTSPTPRATALRQADCPRESPERVTQQHSGTVRFPPVRTILGTGSRYQGRRPGRPQGCSMRSTPQTRRLAPAPTAVKEAIITSRALTCPVFPTSAPTSWATTPSAAI